MPKEEVAIELLKIATKLSHEIVKDWDCVVTNQQEFERVMHKEQGIPINLNKVFFECSEMVADRYQALIEKLPD